MAKDVFDSDVDLSGFALPEPTLGLQPAPTVPLPPPQDPATPPTAVSEETGITLNEQNAPDPAEIAGIEEEAQLPIFSDELITTVRPEDVTQPKAPERNIRVQFQQTGRDFAAEQLAQQAAAERQAAQVQQMAIRAMQSEAGSDTLDNVASILEQGTEEERNKLNGIFDEIDTVKNELRETARAVREGRVEPQRLFSNTSAAGKFGAALAVAVGQMVATRTGGPNAALQIINDAIDRDIQAQQFNLQNNRANLNSEIQLLDRLRAGLKDEQAATSFMRQLRLEDAETRLKQMSLRAQSEFDKQQIQVLLASVQEQKARAASEAAAAQFRVIGDIPISQLTGTVGRRVLGQAQQAENLALTQSLDTLEQPDVSQATEQPSAEVQPVSEESPGAADGGVTGQVVRRRRARAQQQPVQPGARTSVQQNKLQAELDRNRQKLAKKQGQPIPDNRFANFRDAVSAVKSFPERFTEFERANPELLEQPQSEGKFANSISTDFGTMRIRGSNTFLRNNPQKRAEAVEKIASMSTGLRLARQLRRRVLRLNGDAPVALANFFRGDEDALRTLDPKLAAEISKTRTEYGQLLNLTRKVNESGAITSSNEMRLLLNTIPKDDEILSIAKFLGLQGTGTLQASNINAITNSFVGQVWDFIGAAGLVAPANKAEWLRRNLQ